MRMAEYNAILARAGEILVKDPAVRDIAKRCDGRDAFKMALIELWGAREYNNRLARAIRQAQKERHESG